MRKGTVLSLKNLKLTEFIFKNNILVLMALLFILGIAAGTFSFSALKPLQNYSAVFIERFVSDREGSAFFKILLDSFMHSMLMLMIIFTLGTSMLGVVLAPLSLTVRGVLYGGVTAMLYSEYGVKGIAFNAVLVLPSAIIFIIALLLAARESLRFSLVITKMSLPSTPSANLSFDFKNYCGRYLFISLIVLVSAVTDSLLSHSFMSGLKLF